LQLFDRRTLNLHLRCGFVDMSIAHFDDRKEKIVLAKIWSRILSVQWGNLSRINDVTV